jgi:hypothetical protein
MGCMSITVTSLLNIESLKYQIHLCIRGTGRYPAVSEQVSQEVFSALKQLRESAVRSDFSNHGECHVLEIRLSKI